MCAHYDSNEQFMCDTNEKFECLIEEFNLLSLTQSRGIKTLGVTGRGLHRGQTSSLLRRSFTYELKCWQLCVYKFIDVSHLLIILLINFCDSSRSWSVVRTSSSEGVFEFPLIMLRQDHFLLTSSMSLISSDI